jgi:hypothetical protein
MRKLTLLTGSLLALAFALVGGISTPQAAHAICYCDPNEAFTQTTTNWGKGADCTAARNQLLANTAADAYAACGTPTYTCLGNLVLTTACYQVSPGMYQEDGYRMYKCKTCTDPIDPDPQM